MDHLFTVTGEAATPISRTGLAAESLLERQHLQEWVIAHPQVLGESVLVITAEYDRWADTDGVPARDRLDVLGLDATGRLVVVELKRGTADRDVHLQAITYAALVSRFDLDTLAAAHRDFLSRRGKDLDIDACRQRLLDHVDGEWSPELLQRPRQVIIAADFPKQVTHSVVWLSEMSLDIDLIQVGLWKVEEHVVAGFTKVYPTPEVEEFTLAPARVEGEAAAKKLQERARSRNAVHVLVSAGLLPGGTKLRMTPRHGTTEAIRDAINAWVEEDTSRATAVWTNNTAKPLIWDADDASYSPTGLANHIFRSVTSRTADGIQGTTWWDVDTSQVPGDVDVEEWATLAGISLSGLAKQLNGTRKDWTVLHTLLGAVPAGRWTTYGDVAAVIGSHAVPVGRHLSACGQCPSPWRVLNAEQDVSATDSSGRTRRERTPLRRSSGPRGSTSTEPSPMRRCALARTLFDGYSTAEKRPPPGSAVSTARLRTHRQGTRQPAPNNPRLARLRLALGTGTAAVTRGPAAAAGTPRGTQRDGP